MSAFMCGRSHVCTIAQFAADKGILPRAYASATEFANDCLRENARSMDARYADRWHGDGDYPPPVLADDAEVLQWAREEHMRPIDVIKLIDCLNYQSCETQDWDSTTLCRVLIQLKSALVGWLPGWKGAPWGIDDKRTNVVSLSALAARGRR